MHGKCEASRICFKDENFFEIKSIVQKAFSFSKNEITAITILTVQKKYNSTVALLSLLSVKLRTSYRENVFYFFIDIIII